MTSSSAKGIVPDELLLDGQQRMTSIYQATLRAKVAETLSVKNKKIKRWFYVDIRKALDPNANREDVEVERIDRRPLQERRNAADDNELDVVGYERLDELNERNRSGPSQVL